MFLLLNEPGSPWWEIMISVTLWRMPPSFRQKNEPRKQNGDLHDRKRPTGPYPTWLFTAELLLSHWWPRGKACENNIVCYFCRTSFYIYEIDCMRAWWRWTVWFPIIRFWTEIAVWRKAVSSNLLVSLWWYFPRLVTWIKEVPSRAKYA